MTSIFFGSGEISLPPKNTASSGTHRSIMVMMNTHRGMLGGGGMGVQMEGAFETGEANLAVTAGRPRHDRDRSSSR